MNVILLEKVGKLGNIGDVADVKSGYARNYLFPSGIAIPATKENLAEFEHRKADLMAAHNEKVAAAQSRVAKIEGLSLVIEANASDEGKLFGSVGTKEIAEAITEAGGETDKSEVQLPHGVIRETGRYEIVIDLGFDIQATINLTVAGQGGAEMPLVEPETGEELTASQDDSSVEESAEESATETEVAGDEEKSE
ncbi:MAG: 50S ribosomal protein L9 [Gammaproteobacteria bacterium]|nr:50S ribosomal protein L9 [Gammaproteobacteria bacterium]